MYHPSSLETLKSLPGGIETVIEDRARAKEEEEEEEEEEEKESRRSEEGREKVDGRGKTGEVEGTFSEEACLLLVLDASEEIMPPGM
ncbi:hypothetical protein HZH66_012097 [Vespula vulgaris]|uniref:Uncharacterized protein n=1 Tax=Vespula vulgaris TaxID=7454 RepID=A0A834JAN9_VESVU|nr:hypothetical protein HZH66_012097 [Vespula vulgaris]